MKTGMNIAAAAMVLLLAYPVSGYGQEGEPSEEAAEVIQFLGWECDDFTYDDLCITQIRNSLEAAEELSEGDQEHIYAKVRSYKDEYPYLAARIDAVLEDFSVPLTNPEE